MEGDSGVTRSMIDQLHSLDIQEYQTEEESRVTRSIIDGLFSSDMIKWKVKVPLPEISWTIFILRTSK